MSQTKRDFSLWVFAAVLMVGGGAMMFTENDKWHSPAEALFVAGLLMATVDRYVKLRLRDDIAHDVFFAALGIHLPTELKDEILAIGDCKLVRRKMTVTYKLTPHHDANFVCCDTVTEFEMQNLTQHVQTFEHQVWVGRSPSGVNDPPQPILFVRAQIGGKVEHEYSASELKIEQREHERGWHAPVKIPAEGCARFWSTTRQVLPSRFEDVYLLLQPTVGIRVSVDAPAHLTPCVTFDHRLQAEAASLPLNTWEFNGAFLPHSTFRIAWRSAEAASGAVDIGPRLQVKDVRPVSANIVRRDIG